MKNSTLQKLLRIFIVSFLLVSVLPAAVQAQTWYNSSWLYRKAITIDYTKVGTGPHTNFPVLINITDADLQTDAQADFDDILFTSSDGTTKLDHEVESYTSGTGALVAWVEIPSLSSTANTVIYMYYGNVAATAQQNITGTWNANYSGVYHLNNSFNDATTNARNGVNTGSTNVGGKIASGRGFTANGTNNITISGLMGSPANVTLSAWENFTSLSTTSNEVVSVGDRILIRLDNWNTAVDVVSYYYDGSTYNSVVGACPTTGWHYISTTFDDAGNSQKSYVDGVLIASGSFTGSISYGGTNTVIGNHANGGGTSPFAGTLDEVRVANTPRPVGWILTEYNNQNSPSTFYSVGSEATEPPALTWYNSSWLYRKAITIDYTKVSAGAHTDFPVLINITDANLQAGAQADFDDILFTSANGSTKLSHEVESYTSGTGALTAWVEIPSLSSTANTVIYMYYGNAAATAQQDIPGTWNTAYKGVWHMNTVFTDATSNANNGTNSGTGAGTGKISGGRTFSKAVPNYITINGLMGSPANATLSGWGNLSSRDATGAGLINIGDYISINVDDVTDGYLGGYYNAGWGLTKSSPKLNPAGSGWHYFVYTFNDAGNTQSLYMDGALVGSGTFANSISYATLGPNTIIGKHANGNTNYDFDGTIDEVRVSNAIRSAGWVLTEYNNQNSPSTFYSVGAETCNSPNISQIPTSNLISNYKFTGNANSETGSNNGTLQNTPTLTTNRFGIASSAYTFNGSSQYVSTANSYANPTNFTISIWFKTATTSGGNLMGFGLAQTGSSANYDRNIYMNNAGKIYFGCYNGTNYTVNSPLSYNDNNWHFATATLSSTTGMVLYMDGVQVATGANTTAQNYTGYWRIGYENLTAWPSIPTSYYFNGTLDDVLVYHTALNSTQVATLYNSPDGAGNNGPGCASNTLTLTATTVSGATYAWTGPNGFTSTSQNPTLTYTASYAGLYTVQVTAGGCSATAYTNVTTAATSSTISYAGSPYCITAGTASVTFAGTAGGTYSSTAGLTINSSTGAVTLGTSTAGAYTVTYTVTGGCTATTAITVTASPTTSAAGADQTGAATCGLTTVTLAANAPTVGTGAWSIISGTGGSFGNATSATSTFSGTAGTTYTLRWTISNAPCTASPDDVVITFNQAPTTSAAGADQTGSATCGLTTVTLAANVPTIGTGGWSIISGAGGSFGNAASATSTFSGTAGTTYTLRWTISNAPCTASPDDVVITFNQAPTTSAAGADQTGSATCGLTTVTLAANAPTIGTGAWSIISGAGGSFGNAASATSTFSGTAGTTYTLRWTISNSPCTASPDDVVITFNQAPTTSAAGADQTGAATCGLTTVTLAANAPTIGTGAWSIISGAGGSFGSATSATSTFSGTAGTTYTLRWTISNSPCTASPDDVVITFNQAPTTSAAGADQTGSATCGLTTVTLAANVPTIGTGGWSIISGAGGSFGNAASATSTFSGTAGTTYTLRWTISNSPCTASPDDVVITFNQAPTTSAAGADQTGVATCGLTTVTLAANAPTIGTGAWSIISGTGGSFGNAASATSTFSGTAGTTYTIRWTISNAPCTASPDDVVITFNQAPTTSAAGPDQTGAATCGLTTVTLAANVPTIGTGAWSIISGAGGSFGNAASATSTFSGTAGTTYTIRWTISNSPCTASPDDVLITFTPTPAATISYAGAPYYVNGGTATVTFAGTTGGTYSSTAGLSINASTGDVTLGTSTPANYTVTYTIAAAGGCSVYTTTTSITVLSNTKSWDGGAGTNNWGDAANWNADGIPGSSDNVDLTGANTININVAATTNNLLMNNASLVLTVNSGNSLTVSGNLTLTAGTFNTAAAFPTVSGTVNVANGTVGFTGSSTQTIPAYNYNNLTSSSTGSRTFASSGTIGVAGTFTPGTNAYTITGSTVNYNAAGVQTVAAFNYNNLTLSNSGIKTFATGTAGIASALSVTGSATANATTNSSVISYNGSVNQTITALTYYGLNVSSTGGTVTGITTTVTNFTINSGTVDLNTNTLTTTGTATYTSGTINNGTVTSTGATSTFAGTTFGAIVNATSDNLALNGSVFNSPVILTKNGTTAFTSNGGNTFNSTATIASSSSASFILANTSPDIFNGTTVFTNTGTAFLYIANNSTGNQFNGNVTFNNTGTASTIRSSFGSSATAVYSGNIVVNNTSTGGIHFGASGGTTTLAATKTITKGGTGFTTGTLLLRDFTQLGSTAQALTLTGSVALLQMGPSTIFNGGVNFISPQLILNGTTFNGTASLTKNGGTDNVSSGGNIFNGVTTLVCSGAASLDLGSTIPETFNSDLTINNTGTYRVQIGISSVGNLFNGNVTINHGGNTPGVNTLIARNAGSTATINGNLVLNCTNTNTGSGIVIANDGQVTINGNITVSSTNGRGILFGAASGSATLANGFTISAGTFTTGTLTFSRFIQTGSTAQNITLTGTANLLAGTLSVFNGPVNFSAPQLFLNGCQYNNTAALTKNGATDNTSTGANIFNAAATITNSGAGFLRLANTTFDDFNSDATFIQTGSGLLQPAYATNCTIAGNLSTAGTATAISFGTGIGTITLDGTGAQSIAGSLSPTIRNLIIANTGNTITPGVNTSVLGNLTLTSGTFDLGSYTANRFTAGGTLTISNGARLKIGGSNTIPSNYSAHSIGATSTIEYSGTTQSVAILNSSQNYGNLTVSGSGTEITTGNITVRTDLSITAGSLNINTYTLKIGGSISNSGTFTASNGTIEMNGSSAQTIPAATFAGKTISNLTINNTAGVTLADTLKLTNDLTVSNGALATGGYLVLKSSATANARVAQITSVAGTPINGNVIVERYVQGRRKYRLITSSVTTHSNAVLIAGQEGFSIWGNWQNSGINTTPNVGSLITGGSGADGFDAGTPNASLYTYNDVTRAFVGYTTANGKNTKYTSLKAGAAYLMFVYGDRLNSVAATSPHNTVLVETGLLKTGDQIYNTGSSIPLSGVTGRFTLLGNPFASPIDWATIPKTNLDNTYWGWDPNLSSTGGYITVTTTGTVTLQAPYSGSTGLNQYIQPGQGFFVKTSAASPVLTIREQDKVSNFNSNAFRTGDRTAGDLSLLAINLQYVSSGNKVLADGVLAAFDAAFSNQAGTEDGTKMANGGETIAILNDTTALSIDARQVPQNNDTLFLNVSRLTKPQYTLQIFAQHMEGDSIQPFLEDRYLNTIQALSLIDTNNIVFNVSAGDPASSDINRFRIIFQSNFIVVAVKFISIKANQLNKDIQVDWEVAEESGIQTYEIERSADGIHFTKAGEVAARGNNSNESYHWLDVNPITGNNYYHVRAIEADGRFFISKMVVVKMNAGNAAFKIFPNPVKNQQINIRSDDLGKGKYTLVLHNLQGQQITWRVVDHPGGPLNQIIYLSKLLPAGMYHLQVANENKKTEYSLSVLIE